MEQYISKTVVVAEIERLKTIYKDDENIHHVAKYNILVDILSFLDTLAVKEVDLESKQRMSECPYRQVECMMYKDKILECNGACSWVVDYMKLKKIKTQKEK